MRKLAFLSLFLASPCLAVEAYPHTYLTGVVNEESVISTAKQLSVADAASETKDIILEINSPGGSVFAGLQLVNYMKHLDHRVVCVVDVEAYSMAFYILQTGCDARLMTRGSTIMSHKLSAHGIGGTADEIAILTYRMRVQERALEEAEGARLKGGVAWLRKWLDDHQELWLDTEGALKVGAVDGVVGSWRDVEAWLKA